LSCAQRLDELNRTRVKQARKLRMELSLKTRFNIITFIVYTQNLENVSAQGPAPP